MGTEKSAIFREIIYGKKRALRYWKITTDIDTIPEKPTWYVMTQIREVLAKKGDNLY